ncbi:AP-1 complex subunit gamma-2-like [Silene latifolia]
MNPFSSGTRLRDMIRSIRACKTAAEERAVVRKECAAIRAAISENDPGYRHRNMAKLMFIHMLGYPTHFGQMECLKLIAAPGFPEKRIGYLGLMLLLDERQEVLMLVTNSLKQDLNHTNQYIVGLALCALGNICSAEMARDLAPEVERLLQFRDPNVRKKAALCSIRIIKKVPDLAENFINPAAALLKEKHHGVLITGVQLCTDLCKVSEDALEYFRKKCTDAVVRVLKDLVNSSYAPEYDVAGITDPFLHIRLLRFLRVLGHGDADASDCMNDILAQVATKTESNKNAGNAILYECVDTIMSIEDNSGLRVLAINILGRFLSNKDNNIRYVALNMLMRAINVDSQAVQRHRTTILECVKDSDASIRKRALELVYLLVNESNVKPLTKELIEYLEASDHEFKGDLSTKICSIVEKFSPEKIWYIDQMMKVLSEAGNYVKDEVWHALIVVISNAVNLHGYTVRSLYRAVQASTEQETLVKVAVWCFGEYGDMLVNNVGMLDIEEPITVTESDVIDIIEMAIKRHNSDIATSTMCLIALLKLSSRFPPCSQRVKEILVQHKGSLLLELQQRAIEFNSIIERHQNIRSTLMERMPVLDEATYSGRKSGSLPASISSSNGPSANLPNGIPKAAAIAAPLVDLLDLSSDDLPVPSSSGGHFLQDLLGDLSASPLPSGSSQNQKSGTDALLDLLSIGSSPAANTSAIPDILSLSLETKHSGATLEGLSSVSSIPKQVSSLSGPAPMMDLLDGLSSSQPTLESNGLQFPSIVAFESSSLKMTFDFAKDSANPQTTSIKATFVNLSVNIYTDFVFQAAVPKFLQLHLDPASNTTLPAAGNGSITQSLRVTNSQHGKKPLVMRFRIGYKVNGKDVLEEGQISNFPRNL